MYSVIYIACVHLLLTPIYCEHASAYQDDVKFSNPPLNLHYKAKKMHIIGIADNVGVLGAHLESAWKKPSWFWG